MSFEKFNPQNDPIITQARIYKSLQSQELRDKLIPDIVKNMRAIGYCDSTSQKIGRDQQLSRG